MGSLMFCFVFEGFRSEYLLDRALELTGLGLTYDYHDPESGKTLQTSGQIVHRASVLVQLHLSYAKPNPK